MSLVNNKSVDNKWISVAKSGKPSNKKNSKKEAFKKEKI